MNQCSNQVTARTEYDLELRTLQFADDVNHYVSSLPKTVVNLEVGKQLVRAAGSVGANYIEANESLGKKDFVFRMRISRKEAKEARYWLVLSQPIPDDSSAKESAIGEATELLKILSAIIAKSV